MTAYATSAQYVTFTGGAAAPTGIDRLLTRASEVIDHALRTSIYEVSASTGLPTDAAVIQAFADATCAQVEFWMAGDEEDDILGPVQSVALAGVSVTYGSGNDRVSPMYLAPRAHRILVNAGLRDGQPSSW